MVSAYARGYQVLGEEKYLDAASRILDFLMDKLKTKDKLLLRTYRAGKSKLPAYLEDYAYTLRAMIDLYEAGFELRWLLAADEIAKEMIHLFWDEEDSGFFNTGEYHKNLILRVKTPHDQAVPSPISVATMSLLRLSILLGNRDYSERAEKTLRSNHYLMEQSPRGYLSLLNCVDFLLNPAKEIVIVGRRDSKDTKALLEVINRYFIPNRVVAFLDPDQADAKKVAATIPLLAGRNLLDGKAVAYVCENYVCKYPVTSPEDLLEQLNVRGRSVH
jgi:uncharacterized protein YyaL (SSP411 family)